MHHGARADMQSIVRRIGSGYAIKGMQIAMNYMISFKTGETTNLADSSDALHRRIRQDLNGKLDAHFKRIVQVPSQIP